MNFKGYDLDTLESMKIKETAEFARIAGAEGLVLLKNKGVLPFDTTKTVSIFGRTQIDYIRCGTGSGGFNKPDYVITILDGLKDRIKINQDLLDVYIEWLKDHPFDNGIGWASEPWAQVEMPVSDELCKEAAEKSDYALIVIGRRAGEDRDNKAEPESYLLSETEEKLIETVMKHFDKVCVAVNAGNIMDMKWVEKYNIPSVLYCWQGGMEGGNAFADVVLGAVSPSGRLTDTIAYDIEDYSSTKNHGDLDENVYQEDIYTGYRYFETFAKDKVMYPFGYGLSYTDFSYNYSTDITADTVKVYADVKNIGNMPSKTVVQVYYSAPQGRLGKPARELAGYKKTSMIAPGEVESVVIEFPVNSMASYDDMESFSYILEKGEYKIFAGENVRDAKEVSSFEISEDKVVQKLRQALAPVDSFERMKPAEKDGGYEIAYENVRTRDYDLNARMMEHISDSPAPIEDKGITLKDVADGKNTLDEFVLQLTEDDLICIVKGEGLNSPKVTRGTAGAIGGVTNELLEKGVPLMCCADGPAGVKLHTTHNMTLIPNGTCLASTWNDALVEEIYSYMGIEMRVNNIDILLAPGINIHRHPLNGRNFEYFSEDPHLGGKIAAACTRGLDSVGLSGCVKHFACNSQEANRHEVNSVVSERALREIYLKPFEIAVKEGNVKAIMTSYNLLNGTYTHSSYDLCTSILRDEWGYTGFVMSDWWPHVVIGAPLDAPNKDLASMNKAQNDIYMVVQSSRDFSDNLALSLKDGSLSIEHLRKSAKNLLSFMLTSPALKREVAPVVLIKREDYDALYDMENIVSGEKYDFSGVNALELKFMTSGSPLAQYIINIYAGDNLLTCAFTKGAVEKEMTVLVDIAKDVETLSFDFPDAFNYMNITALKKK